MNQLPRVKAWIRTEAPKFDNVNVEYQHGKTPTMHFYDSEGNTLFKEVVSAMSADEINLLLSRNGFQFRPEPTPEVEAPPQPVAVNTEL